MSAYRKLDLEKVIAEIDGNVKLSRMMVDYIYQRIKERNPDLSVIERDCLHADLIEFVENQASYACLICGKEIVSAKIPYCFECAPSKLYVRIEKGFIGRAFRESEINWSATPPPGVSYVEYELTSGSRLKNE